MGITEKDVLKTVLKVPQLEEQLESISIKVVDINSLQLSNNKKYILADSQNVDSLLNMSDKKNLALDGYNNTLTTTNLTQGYNIENCSNFAIENIIFDFNLSTTKGLKFKNCNNIVIRNVTFKNLKEKSINEGYLYALDFLGCKDILIENCKFINIDGSTSANGVARAIQAENDGSILSERIVVENCVFDTILPVTDADAIHFNQTQAPIYATVRNCTFIDCAKRGVKAQAPNVIVEKCKFYDVNYLDTTHDSAILFFYNNCKAIDNFIKYKNSSRGIFVYNVTDISNIDIINNYVNITGSGDFDGISIGIVNDIQTYNNITLLNNKVFGANLRYSIYMPHCLNSLVDNNYIESGTFVLGLTDQVKYFTENIKVVNNTIKPSVALRGSNIIFNNNLFESGIVVDNATTNTENVTIDNNTFRNCAYGVISSTNNISGYKITNNTFKSITTKDVQINGADHIIENNIHDKLIGGSYTKYNQGSIDFNPATLSAGSGVTSAGITVPNARLGDFVVVSAPYNLQNCIAHAYVSSSTQVQIRVQNVTGSPVTFASGLWKVKIVKS